MPNYNYHSNDYMRRNQCPRQMTAVPARIEREYPSFSEERSADYCTNDLLKGMPLAMAYIPWQEWKNLHSAEKALEQGTIFEDLDKPFLGIGGCCR